MFQIVSNSFNQVKTTDGPVSLLESIEHHVNGQSIDRKRRWKKNVVSGHEEGKVGVS